VKERFYRELGRVIGTDADPAFWARNFGCSVEGAAAILNELKAERRAVERDGRLYRA
jgi:hypothetical protein